MSVAACMTLPRTAHGTPESPAITAATGLVPAVVALPSSKTHPSALDRAPVEVLVDVFQHLDLHAAFSLAATNKRLDRIFTRNRAVIVLRIVEREFSPLNGLLQVVKASPADLAVPWGTWLDKRIRRKNVVLCPGGVAGVDRRTNISFSSSLANIRCTEAEITNADIDRILDVCRVVRGWERIFPQHRFNASPVLTRSLSERENFRLRRALYNWMRYAYYFHGDLPRPNVFVPGGRDVRINHLRALCNSQLGELADLWRTVEDIIEMSLCPSVDIIRIGADFQISEKAAAEIGWGEERENKTVVATMSKLSPRQLLHYLDNGHKYTKVRLIADIRQRMAYFESDTESLTSAMSVVSMERWRQMQRQFPALVQDTGSRVFLPVYTRVMSQFHGGTLDWDDAQTEMDLERVGGMVGVGLDWRPEEFFGFRPEIPTGMLDP